MNKTKKQTNDLRKKLEKRLTEDQARIASVNSEIVSIRAEISKLQKEIDGFSDFDNVSEFNALKEKKADAKSKLELLERKLKSNTNPGADVIRSDYDIIQKAKTDIFENFAKESEPILEQLRALYESTENDLNQLRNLHLLWLKAYDISALSQYGSINTLNNTIQRTRQFLAREDSLKNMNIY